MNYQALLSIVMWFASPAHAQFAVSPQSGNAFGTNVNPCLMQGAPGAVSSADPLANLSGTLDRMQALIDAKKKRLEDVDRNIKEDRVQMAQAMTKSAVEGIVTHRQHNYTAEDYGRCARPSGAGQIGSAALSEDPVPGPAPGSREVRDGGDPAGGVEPSSAYCYKNGSQPIRGNTWHNLIANSEAGHISDYVCELNAGGTWARVQPARADACRSGLSDYYSQMDERDEVQKAIEKVRTEMRQLRRKADKLQDEMTEAALCPTCHLGTTLGAGNYSPGVMQSVSPVVSLLGQSTFVTPQQYQMGVGGSAILAARPNVLAPAFAPVGYPGGAYASQIPGYMGTYNGVYGGVPGAVGTGGFGCQNPNLLGNQFANPAQLYNPNAQNALFNPGYGPGFQPVLGNGTQLPYFAANTNLNAPATLPLLAQTVPYPGAYGNPAAYAGGPLITPGFGNSAYAYGIGSYQMQMQQLGSQFSQIPVTGVNGVNNTLPAVYRAPINPTSTGYGYPSSFGYGGGYTGTLINGSLAAPGIIRGY